MFLKEEKKKYGTHVIKSCGQGQTIDFFHSCSFQTWEFWKYCWKDHLELLAVDAWHWNGKFQEDRNTTHSAT